MANDHMFLAKIKGSEIEPEPEQFMFITLAEDWGTIKRTGKPMSEKEARAALHKAGMPEAESMGRIAQAREHPI